MQKHMGTYHRVPLYELSVGNVFMRGGWNYRIIGKGEFSVLVQKVRANWAGKKEILLPHTLVKVWRFKRWL